MNQKKKKILLMCLTSKKNKQIFVKYLIFINIKYIKLKYFKFLGLDADDEIFSL